MKESAKYIVEWVRHYFESNNIQYAVLGLSGGKDSTVTAAVLAEAIGPDRVVPVQMPNGVQKDINDSTRVMDFLKIPAKNRFLVNINESYKALLDATFGRHEDLTTVITTNLPARLRMCTLYNVAAYLGNARVIATSNRSETYVGYATKWGDVGDLGILTNLTVREILNLGDDLGLPYDLVHKVPSDGMSGKSDEDNLGFSYSDLDDVILESPNQPNEETLEKINKRYKANLHKHTKMPTPELPEELKNDLR